MQQRNLGRSGLRVSVVGLGCNNFGMKLDREDTRRVVHKALDCGITLFDTADSYGNMGGSEEALGLLLGDRRKDIVLATKFASPMDPAETKKGASRRYILSAVEASLGRLKTDWIDLYQLHRPDPLTPIEETLRTLDDLVRAGKVRYIGCSNLPAWQVVDALWTAKQASGTSFVCCQDEYSLLVRDIERELVPAISAHGLGLLPYFPLASADRQVSAQRGDAAERSPNPDEPARRPLPDPGELANSGAAARLLRDTRPQPARTGL
jgi:aryl-alcohol dehydrogenase-like predicted oxidoreductase